MITLVTGGAGYIGSHTVLELLNQGTEVIVLDNLSNSSYEAIQRVEDLADRSVTFYQGDILEPHLLDWIFKNHDVDNVIHFAGLKSVGESVEEPEKYYNVNVVGTLELAKAMKRANVKNLVFSSSATVYGTPEALPIDELAIVGNTSNPYGTSKYMSEIMLKDIVKASPSLSVTLLRYFNPAGAHESGMIGESPNGIPNNLLPYISQVAVGKLEELAVFGDDYDTPDGTGVRDYIHVVDLAQAHLKALDNPPAPGTTDVFNIGTGKGYSVLELLHAFKIASGSNINHKIHPRRPGDVAACYANPDKARIKLGWVATRDINTMVMDAWNWQVKNPNGF